MAKPWELRKQLKVIIVKVFLVIQQQANSLFGFLKKSKLSSENVCTTCSKWEHFPNHVIQVLHVQSSLIVSVFAPGCRLNCRNHKKYN